MTYTEAAKHNQQFNLTRIFTDPKQLGDGCHLRWARDPEGKIGYVRGIQQGTGDILMMYPIRVLKQKVELKSQMWPDSTWPEFELLKN